MTDLFAQNRIDLLPAVIPETIAVAVAGLRRQFVEHRHAAGKFGELRAHLLDRNCEIDEAGRDGAVRHVAMARSKSIGGLRDGQPATLFHRFGTERAVEVEARKDDRRGALALVLGERAEKDVNRLALTMSDIGFADLKPAVGNPQDGVGRQHENAIWLHFRAVNGHLHRQSGVAPDDLVEHAFALGIEVGYDNNANSGFGRHAFEKALKRLDVLRWDRSLHMASISCGVAIIGAGTAGLAAERSARRVSVRIRANPL